MEMTSGMFSSLSPTWRTPRDSFDKWNAEFSFNLDAAALENSALCPDWFGPDHSDPTRRDAFEHEWNGNVWLNPPYGREIKFWLEKANREATTNPKNNVVVCLIPARTDTAWFHDYCIHHEVRLLRGRLRFSEAKSCAPFPSALVIMKGN